MHQDNAFFIIMIIHAALIGIVYKILNDTSNKNIKNICLIILAIIAPIAWWQNTKPKNKL